MDKLTVTLKTVTPMFLGGSNPNDTTELRAPSIKGALRFWYRAIDPLYNHKVEPSDPKSPTWEDKIFGSTEHGQGAFLLSIQHDHPVKGDNNWDDDRYKALNMLHPEIPASLPQSEVRKWTLNGVRYLTYSINMGDNRRKFIGPGNRICFCCLFRRNLESGLRQKAKKAIFSSVWLLGHLGGLGSRSRRGIGTVALEDWKWNDSDVTNLPLVHQQKTTESWLTEFTRGKDILKGWYTQQRNPDHSVFGKNTSFYLYQDGQVARRVNGTDFEAWELALGDAGVTMQLFRQRWKLDSPASDYHQIKAHLAQLYPKAPAMGINPSLLEAAPERAAFGLPLTFRYESLKYQKTNRDGTPKFKTRYGKTVPDYEVPETTFQGIEYDRSASRIHLRIIKIGDRFYPFYFRTDGPVLKEDERLKDTAYTATYPLQDDSVLDDFAKCLAEKSLGKNEVKW